LPSPDVLRGACSVAPGSSHRGEVLLAPCTPGEVIMISLNGHTSWSIMCRSFLAADDHVATGSSVLEYTESEVTARLP
jgi:uncharacterized protein (AIM24 family)